MKCDKCGFVSFDYLAECRRCGADLSAIRERLGFSALKSEVPFLLGTLLKGGGETDPSLVRFGREPEGSAGERLSDPALEHSLGVETSPPEAEAIKDQTAGEELIIELSEADLESLAGGKGSNR